MPSYKDAERGTWYCSFYYSKSGKRHIKKKRGFSSKRDSLAFERTFLEQHQADMNIKFGVFWEIYLKDMEVRLRENTINTKKYIVELKILPTFKDMHMSQIKPCDIREWQNMLIKSNYKPTYLKTVNTQLVAIFNYAVRYYDLRENPCSKTESIGSNQADEMDFWTKEEFNTFIVGVENKIQSYIAFKLLFWSGCRCGDLLAISYADFIWDDNILSISKSYQRIKGRDVITAPKNKYSIRKISLPTSLMEEIKEYTSHLYGFSEKDRIFPFSKAFLEHEMKRGVKETGVKKIRLHDIRHSHTSYLLEQNTPIFTISKRLGHSTTAITERVYCHMTKPQEQELSDKLNELFDEKGYEMENKG